MNETSTVLLIGLLAIATWHDVRSHRIPNALILTGWISGVLLSAGLNGMTGIASAIAGGIIGLAALLPFYLIRTLGAGDVKLMAVVGVFLGPGGVLMAILGTFLAGGIMALVMAIRMGTASRLLQNVKLMLFGVAVKISAGQAPIINDPPVSVGKLPYAAAISVGTLGYLIWQHTG
ncbi:MAG: prepilin peptidase [Sulfuriferula sp.]|nr:prepilin peptidase [Sulfuriferula sp.]